MTDTSTGRLRKINRALISVSDKTGLIDFAKLLERFDVDIISTGGTAKALREAGVSVRDVSDVTGFPEMMDGRLKTLHPRIHGGLLALRDSPEHVASMREHDITPIDLVVINLYPFKQTISKEDVTVDEAIEQIDIGGPAMIRSAAKNHADVAVVVDPGQYDTVATEIELKEGATTFQLRRNLASAAFAHTAEYDSVVSQYFNKLNQKQNSNGGPGNFSEIGNLTLHKINDLRYGENPHQRASLYRIGDSVLPGSLAAAELLAGKEMSFNNYVDAEAAWQLVSDFDQTACAIIKHTNPAGVGLGGATVEAYEKALATDPVSAFGGVVSFNRTVDPDCATVVTKIFTEVVIAPDFDNAALEIFRTKKNLRVLRMGAIRHAEAMEYKQISGGMLLQAPDNHKLRPDDLKFVTQRRPTTAEISALLFAWTVCKHTKSNAIVYAHDGQTVGVGAGQMSRVDSVRIGAMRANLSLKGSVLASDAFFPFRDGVDEAAKHGITAVIQPGGSIRDDDVIAAADEHGLAMVFTGVRHFKH